MGQGNKKNSKAHQRWETDDKMFTQVWWCKDSTHWARINKKQVLPKKETTKQLACGGEITPQLSDWTWVQQTKICKKAPNMTGKRVNIINISRVSKTDRKKKHPYKKKAI